MTSEKRLSISRKIFAILAVMLSCLIFSPSLLRAAGETSYAEEIRRCVAEDKVYLIENFRQKVTLPGEKLVIDALLSEDAPQAVVLYQRQLAQYPNPVLDQISNSRIAAYGLAKERVTPLPKRTVAAAEPSTKPKSKPALESSKEQLAVRKEKPTKLTEEATLSTVESTAEPVSKSTVKKPFALQCGSFKSRENADQLAKKVAQHTPATIIQQGESYKVLLKIRYSSKQEAAAAAKKLPFETLVVRGL